MSSSLPPGTPGRAHRHADRPTATRAAGASLRALGRVLALLAGEPARRWRRHETRVALGAAVARHLAGQPPPGFLAPPVAAHRAAELRLASTEPPSRGRRAARPPAAGPRASRSAGRDLDVVAELERLLLVVVLFLPRLAARVRLRVAEARLGAWAVALADLPDPEVAMARERAAAVQRRAAEVGAALAASRQEAVEQARTAVALGGAAAAELAAWLARGVRAATARLQAWLAAAAAATARGLRAAGAASGRGLRAAAAGSGRGLRAAAASSGRGLRAAGAAGGRGLRGALAGIAAAGAGVAAVGVGVAGFFAGIGRAVLAAANGTAAWIDGLVARGRSRRGRRGRRRRTEEPAPWAPGPPPGPADDRAPWAAAPPDPAEPAPWATTAPPDPAGTAPWATAPAEPGEPAPWGTAPAEPAEPAAAMHNGRFEGAGAATLPRADDPGAATEPWWLPSHLEEPAPTAHRARRRARQQDPVVAGLAAASGRAARRLGRAISALAAPPDHRRAGWLPFIRPVAVALTLALLAGTAAAVPTGMLVAESVKGAAAGLPDLDELKPLRQPERTQIYDRNGRLIEVLHDEQDRIVVPLSKVAQRLQQAVIAAEDARFFEHGGIDDRGILRAALANVVKGDVTQGGSTITQQLVRNAYPDLRELSLVRKIKEAALAAQLEARLSKQQILEGYLNRIYFGAGYYGVQAASKGYFGRSAADVSLAQAAMLAGVIREPESANPREHPERARELRDSVLDRMAALGMVPPAEADKARRQPVKVKKAGTVGGRYPWFVDGLRRQLEQDPRLGKTREQRVRQLFEGGLRIYTTLDGDLQLAAEQAVRNHLPASGPQIALIAVDPRNGAVRAVVGGNNYSRHKYNVAVQGQGRQPGSSFKPFVLAAALDAGISPDSVWESSAFQAGEVCGTRLDPPWNVDNYEGKGGGKITVREATARSVNGVYARLMARLCPARVIEMAKRLGITADLPRAPSIALGSAEVRPIEMASAYGTLANLGEYHRPTFVEKVTRHGKTLIEDRAAGERRISAALAWQVNDILKGVVDHGTGTAANIGRPQAGKTGTNQSYRDAWFVGYTPQLSTAVWMGYPDQQRSMLNVNGIRVTGGSYPAEVWHDFMLAAMVNQEVLDWPRPPEQLKYTVLPPPRSEPKKKRDRKRKRPGPPGNR